MTNSESPRSKDEQYSDYHDDVVLFAEEALKEYQDDPETQQAAEVVWSHIRGSQRTTNNGYMLSTVLYSTEHPDAPGYCDPWTTYADLNDDPRYSDVIRAMAEVCFFSDTMEKFLQLQEEAKETEDGQTT